MTRSDRRLSQSLLEMDHESKPRWMRLKAIPNFAGWESMAQRHICSRTRVTHTTPPPLVADGCPRSITLT